jgi:hypothetical protein
MSNKVIIFRGNSPNKKWQSKVTGFITKWMDYTNSEEVTEAVSGVEEGEFTQRMWALDNRKLYNHARKEVSTHAILD